MSILDLFRKRREQKEIDFEVTKQINGDYNSFKNRLKNSSLIILITGKRGSGKTALGMKFIELLSENRNTYYIGKADLPRFIKQAGKIEDVKNNSAVLIDEAAILFSSRDSMKRSNKFLTKVMAIARHKNLSLIIITQNSAMLELNVLRLADTLIFKEPSLLQSRFERKAISDLFKKAEEQFQNVKEREKHFYVIDDEFEGMLSYSLPQFWSDKISKSFSKF